jgi:RimJ/RimL family protein N-acetyltransferase
VRLRPHSVTLCGERVTLRPMTEDDWDLLLRWNNDPEVLYFSEGDEVCQYTLDQVQQIYRGVSQRAFCFMVEVGGVPIGECWLQQMNLARILDRYPGKDCRRIDLMIGEKAWWGQGLGTDVIHLLVRFAFEQGADLVFGCDVADSNPASLRAFQRAGFRPEDTLDQPAGAKACRRYDLVLSRAGVGLNNPLPPRQGAADGLGVPRGRGGGANLSPDRPVALGMGRSAGEELVGMQPVQAIHELATRLLAEAPNPVVQVRLLRDVLGRPVGSSDLRQAREGLERNRWVRELQAEQWDDGSWGRLHSRDSRARQRIPTTEWGVERALALGLEAAHPVLRQVGRYLASVLDGTGAVRDPAEKNDRWSVGVQLFAAATLAQIEPRHPALDRVWSLWAAIARRTFASGAYDATAEIRAHQELTGASVRDSYLVMGNRYALALLGARAADLPHAVEAALVQWLWQRPGGIGYLSVPLSPPPRHTKAGPLDRWLSSQELLAHFPSWHDMAGKAVAWLWEARTSGGYWDLGPRPAGSVALPLSASWRKKGARRHDWTTRALALLRRFY